MALVVVVVLAWRTMASVMSGALRTLAYRAGQRSGRGSPARRLVAAKARGDADVSADEVEDAPRAGIARRGLGGWPDVPEPAWATPFPRGAAADPYAMLDRVMDRVTDMMQRHPGELFEDAHLHLDMDVFESDEQFTLRADVPGVKPENIDVFVDDKDLTKVLVINIERPWTEATSETESPEGVKVRRQERRHGKFKRRFTLTKECDTDGIEVSVADGVMECVIPKKEEAKHHYQKIEVKAKASA